MISLKQIVSTLYEFDFTNCTLSDGKEILNGGKYNEFTKTFTKRDLDKGVIVTPRGYQKGLVYKNTHGGEIYNNPKWVPELVSFSFNIFGLKRNKFYRLSVVGRNTQKFNNLTDTTSDRHLEVSTSEGELLLNEDLSDVLENTTYSAIFKAVTTEENIFFTIGKIYINNIILEEVDIDTGELLDDEVEEDSLPDATEFHGGKSNIVGYGVFSINKKETKARYKEVERITGKGLLLSYDSVEKVFLLERDNLDDTIGNSFTNANYIIDINMNKAPYGEFEVTDVSPESSPNTLKQGYLKLKFFDFSTSKEYVRQTGRITIIVRKIM